MKEKCSLIIGSSGFIGSKLKERLSKKNTYTLSKQYKSNIESDGHYFIDLLKKQEVSMLFDHLASKYHLIEIYYLAGESSVENSLESPNLSIQNSIECLTNLLECAVKVNTKLLFASSGAIYDSRIKNFLDEESPILPPSPYAAIKASSENIIYAYRESFGLKANIVRIFSVFGEEMNRFFIYDMVKKLCDSSDCIEFKGDGKQSRDYLHIADVVSGLVLVMGRGLEGEAYNLCSGEGTKINDLVNLAKKILNAKKEVIWNGDKTEGIRNDWYGDNTKILNLGLQISDKRSAFENTVLSLKEKFN